MNPHSFLEEEFKNVERALFESLKREYISERKRDFFQECRARLYEIRRIIDDFPPTTGDIARLVRELGQLANAISLIERAQLGEFSWPFAETIHDIAECLLTEKGKKGKPQRPIIHIVAHGGEYEVHVGPKPAGAERSIVVVAFPRQLKHHVLLHAIFGHELGHAAHKTKHIGAINKQEILPALTTGCLQNSETMQAWLATIRPDVPHRVLEIHRENWLTETFCDLFGLLLFGPAFSAAHRALLEPKHPNPYDVGTASLTHPPYAVRRYTLAKATRLLGWAKPIVASEEDPVHQAECAFLDYINETRFEDWADIFSDDQLRSALDGMKKGFAGKADVRHESLTAEDLRALIGRFGLLTPPLLDGVSKSGVPVLRSITPGQLLHAGWVYWLGRESLERERTLDFYETNRLCDLALLQQRAIDATLKEKRRGNSGQKRADRRA